MTSEQVAAFQRHLGVSGVITNPKKVAESLQNTLGIERRVPAILHPASTEEVKGVVALANENHIPLYPISTGKNMGYGDKVPVRDDNVIVDLSRMNAIRGFDRKLGYITNNIISPGRYGI